MTPGRDAWVKTEVEAKRIAQLYRDVGLDVRIHFHQGEDDATTFWLVCGCRRPGEASSQVDRRAAGSAP